MMVVVREVRLQGPLPLFLRSEEGMDTVHLLPDSPVEALHLPVSLGAAESSHAVPYPPTTQGAGEARPFSRGAPLPSPPGGPGKGNVVVSHDALEGEAQGHLPQAHRVQGSLGSAMGRDESIGHAGVIIHQGELVNRLSPLKRKQVQDVQVPQLPWCRGLVTDHGRPGRSGQAVHAQPAEASVDGGGWRSHRRRQAGRPPSLLLAKGDNLVPLLLTQPVTNMDRPRSTILQSLPSCQQEASTPPVEGGAADSMGLGHHFYGDPLGPLPDHPLPRVRAKSCVRMHLVTLLSVVGGPSLHPVYGRSVTNLMKHHRTPPETPAKGASPLWTPHPPI